jgi:16S rRNA processing protein RimM
VPADALIVATAGRPHGVAGEVRLVPTSGDPERLGGLTRVWIKDADEPAPVARRIESFRIHAGAALVRVEGFGTREDAARLTRKDIWALASELPPWGPDAFGLADVVGVQLWDGDRKVGEVVDVVTNAGRDFFEVESDGRRVLVPAVKDWLVEMDLPGGRIVMRLPAGMLD